jgi:putative DNA primase/helicase
MSRTSESVSHPSSANNFDGGRASVAAIIAGALQTKPELVVERGDLPATARALGDLIAADKENRYFERGVPTRIIAAVDGGLPSAVPLTQHHVVHAAHGLAKPVIITARGAVAVTLPARVADLYLALDPPWGLRTLAGITCSPLLMDDSAIRCTEGYDTTTGLFFARVPQISVPARPSRNDAESALTLLRCAFRTFPFADAARVLDPTLDVEVVDNSRSMGSDESGFLHGLLSAVCRASLWFAPGLVLTAPQISGAGTGKGLLARAISAIAFGARPSAFTSGHDSAELDKRLVAELIEGRPMLFLDNINGAALRSDTLSSVMTERPARVRMLGVSKTALLNSAVFVCVTGNALSISEDLARRFIWCELDARVEDPELRPFAAGFLEEIEARRAELLTAALTIWRWGRQNAIASGKPLGGFEVWSRWVRDPMLALGCPDPVERIGALKARDSHRQRVAEIFRIWWDQHRNEIMTVATLAEPVKTAIDPQGRGRQYLARAAQALAGTRCAGFALTRQDAAGKWNAATYKLQQTTPARSGGGGRSSADGSPPRDVDPENSREPVEVIGHRLIGLSGRVKPYPITR